MKRATIMKIALIAIIATMAFAPALAQESLTDWPHFAEVTTSNAVRGLSAFTVNAEVFDRAREDLADLRLYDSQGREVPYALRVRRQVQDLRLMDAKEFNRATLGNASELSVDLGEGAGEHNEIEVDTEGRNFRRMVNVEGSDDVANWRTFKADATIFRFEANDQKSESNRISYPASRYRYLRIRVFADPQADSLPPTINSVKALMVVREKGEMVKWNSAIIESQKVRHEGAYASAWIIDNGGRVPCSRLTIKVYDESFSRPYVIETADGSQIRSPVAQGEIARRQGEAPAPFVISFDELYARKLRLIVTDYSNPPLEIQSAQTSAAARQVVFDATGSISSPLRLYFGNANANAPRYDFERNMPDLSNISLAKYDLGPALNNPEYRPEEKPLTERLPWLIYIVLAVSSLALAWILMSLARAARRDQAKEKDAAQTKGEDA